MFGLPKSTELNKQIPKKLIYSTFNLNTIAKYKFDADIKKLSIINEISPSTVNLANGKEVSTFYVISVSLRNEVFDEKNIILLTKLINQNILFALQFEDKSKFAVYHTKLIQTDWQQIDKLLIKLQGLTLDVVWQNIIVQVGDIEIEQGKSLDEQLQIDEVRKKLKRDIDILERQARNEKQPKKKLELAQEVRATKNKLEKLI